MTRHHCALASSSYPSVPLSSKGWLRAGPARALGLALVPVLVLALTACAEGPPPPAVSHVTGHENPLLAEWHTDFGVPPFDLIRNEHYEPAFREAMAQHLAEVEEIVANPEPPTFENTIVALELSGSALRTVSRVFGAVSGAHTNDTLQAVDRTMAPLRAAHADDINLNPQLWERIEAVYQQREELDLSPEQHRLLEETHKGFVRRGAALDDEGKERLREINGELAQLSTQYGENVLAETNAYELLVTDTADLGNLPENLVLLAAEKARERGYEEGWVFTQDRPSVEPFLDASPNRELRKDAFLGYIMRGDNGTTSMTTRTSSPGQLRSGPRGPGSWGIPPTPTSSWKTTWQRPRTGC
jgi:peptidyl-dipeptidase Dcp